MEGMLLWPVYQQDRGIYASDLINPTDHQSTKNDQLKPVLTTGPVNTHIDRLFANLAFCYIWNMPDKDWWCLETSIQSFKNIWFTIKSKMYFKKDVFQNFVQKFCF